MDPILEKRARARQETPGALRYLNAAIALAVLFLLGWIGYLLVGMV